MPFEIVPPGVHIDFVGRWRLCAFASVLLLVLCAIAVPLRGIRLGVDFSGGTQLVVRVADPAAGEDGVRAALAALEVRGAGVTRLGAASERLFQVHVPAAHDATPDRFVPLLERALARSVGGARIEKIDFVGPRVGEDLRRSAFVSMALAFALITVYIAFRFSPVYAPGAVVALVHDVLLTAGVFVVLGWEFDLNVVAALLTIVGYSLNDTIVIYDRIREARAKRTGLHLADVVNRAVNETLSRTLLTAGTTVLALLALLVLGGAELRGFSAALLIGIVVGTYSSVYVAAPLVMVLDRLWTARGRPRAAPPEPDPGLVAGAPPRP